jgi:hypothetical protein
VYFKIRGVEMRVNKSVIIKSGICGVLISCLINLSIIVSLYISFPNYIYYAIAITSTITVLILFDKDRFFNVFISCLVFIPAFLITSLAIEITGIVTIAFKQVHGATAEMWAGDGFGIMIINMFSLVGSFAGGILALIYTEIKKHIIESRR